MVGANASFHSNEITPQLSLQCIIDGLPIHVPMKDIDWIQSGDRQVYIISTYLALKLAEKRGLASNNQYPYEQFQPVVRVQRPFTLAAHIWSADAIRKVMTLHGCLLGIFRCDGRRMLAYKGPPKIYKLPKNVKGTPHCVSTVGVGRSGGKEYLEIQNSYGRGWGDQGFGRVDLDGFHMIHGIGVDML